MRRAAAAGIDPNMASVRLAVFDCDGTLVDSARNIVAAMAMAARAVAPDFAALPGLVHEVPACR